jgi:hypothetical protein
MSLTYHVVVPFGLDDQGHPIPLEPAEAPNAESARQRAQRLAEVNAGAVAFSRTGDPASGEFADANIIAVFGTVDVGLLSE